MNLEAQYKAVLELTHQMLECAKSLDWDALTRAEGQRTELVKETAAYRGVLSVPEKNQIAAIISEIERESAEILERIESWQEPVKILLRINNPSP